MILTDNEILKWNDRLEQNHLTKIKLSPIYDKWGRVNIAISKLNRMGIVEYINDIPTLTFRLSFSVTKNRIGEFKKLLQRFMEEGVETKVSIISDPRISEVLRDMRPNCEISEFSEIEHIVNNREFIRTSYTFNGELTSIIAYVSIIEEAIAFFEMIWGYDEDGNEYNLLKFPISSIVTLDGNKSQDYLVLDYKYTKDTNGVRTIRFSVVEMIDNNKSIIKYGKSMTFDESRLGYSRNNRIDNILN